MQDLRPFKEWVSKLPGRVCRPDSGQEERPLGRQRHALLVQPDRSRCSVEYRVAGSFSGSGESEQWRVGVGSNGRLAAGTGASRSLTGTCRGSDRSLREAFRNFLPFLVLHHTTRPASLPGRVFLNFRLRRL